MIGPLLALLLASPAADRMTALGQLEVLRTPDGALTSLAAQGGGRPLVAVVMKGAWCPACKAQLASLARHRGRLKAIDAKVVGLNGDWPAADATPGPFPMLSDPGGALLGPLGFQRPGLHGTLPGLVFVDRCGEVVLRATGRRPGQLDDAFILAMLEKIAERSSTCADLI